MEVATLAGGCFWRMQSIFSRIPGVISTVVGFSGGFVPNPTYQQVRSGLTGHAESIQILFNPQIVSFAQLLQTFFSIHDSTQVNRQGNDIGAQYRSAIFYHSPQQYQVATQYIEQIKMARMIPVVTQVVPYQAFYPAETAHQFFEAKRQQQQFQPFQQQFQTFQQQPQLLITY
jgi:peptide-methionine (S)-S-oxide reductase